MPIYHPSRPPLQRARRGFTLNELLIAVVLLGIVVGATLTVIKRQQRFYRGANEIIDARSQLRQAVSIVPSDLRGVSSVGGDIIAMDSASIQVNSPFGSAVVCAIDATKLIATLPPLNAANTTYTSWQSIPAAGDSAFVFDDGSDPGDVDDAWLRYEILSVTTTTSATACPGSIYTAASDAAKSKYLVTLRPNATYAARVTVAGGALPNTVTVGAVVRFVRPVEYSLYQAGTPQQWYLGFRERRSNSWSAVQAVAGPYSSGTAGRAGLSFAYYDSLGTQLTTTAQSPRVARVDLAVRSLGQDRTTMLTSAGALFTDSLSARIAIRNRR